MIDDDHHCFSQRGCCFGRNRCSVPHGKSCMCPHCKQPAKSFLLYHVPPLHVLIICIKFAHVVGCPWSQFPATLGCYAHAMSLQSATAVVCFEIGALACCSAHQPLRGVCASWHMCCQRGNEPASYLPPQPLCKHTHCASPFLGHVFALPFIQHRSQ